MTRPPAPLALAALACALATSCCTSNACRPESLPRGGLARSERELFELAQYAAREDCCAVLHGLTSPRTRDEHGETKFCLFWDSLRDEETGRRIRDVLADGEWLGMVPDPPKRFAYVRHWAPGPGGAPEAVTYRIRVVDEALAGGATAPRIGLQEQVDDGDFWRADR